MSRNKIETKDGDKIPRKKSPSDKLRDRVRQHISDINDVITDEDIRNSKTDTEEIKEEARKKLAELQDNAKVNEGNLKEEEKKITPWDVLNE